MPDFGDRLTSAFEARGHLCIGIDPHAFLLESWGLPDTAEGARSFGLRVVEAAAGLVAIVKPQVAFFERHGAVGYTALESVLEAARSAGLVVIGDAKRGDVGSTVAAYAAAWLTPGAPLEVDALTVSAYQGIGTLSAPIELARSHGKGLLVLAATSNPESLATQTALRGSGRFAGRTVAAGIVGEVNEYNAGGRLGSIGVVIGATVAIGDYGIDARELEHSPILAPGLGEQGARPEDLATRYGTARKNLIVSASRSVLSAGPSALAASISEHADRLNEAYAG